MHAYITMTYDDELGTIEVSVHLAAISCQDYASNLMHWSCRVALVLQIWPPDSFTRLYLGLRSGRGDGLRRFFQTMTEPTDFFETF